MHTKRAQECFHKLQISTASSKNLPSRKKKSALHACFTTILIMYVEQSSGSAKNVEIWDRWNYLDLVNITNTQLYIIFVCLVVTNFCTLLNQMSKVEQLTLVLSKKNCACLPWTKYWIFIHSEPNAHVKKYFFQEVLENVVTWVCIKVHTTIYD